MGLRRACGPACCFVGVSAVWVGGEKARPRATRPYRGLFCELREAGGGDGLAVAFFFFVGEVEGEARCQGGEFAAEDFFGGGEEVIAAGAAGDAAEDEEVVDVVEVGVVREGVAEVGADGLVNFLRARIAFGHEGLHEFEFFGERQAEVGGDAGGDEEAADGLLGEVLRADAVVAAPFVARGVGAVVHGGEGEFVDPGGDVAVAVDVAGGEAGAEGEAEDGVFAEGHRAGEGGDFAVVDDFEGDAGPGLLDFVENIFDPLLEDFLGHAAKERGDFHAVVHIDAGGAAADGIDAGQMRGGAAEGVEDAVEVVLRVDLEVGVPDGFVAEDDGAVDDGGDFAVAAAEVEADAAAVEVASERTRGGAGRGWGAGDGDFERVVVDALTDEVGIEAAGGGFAEVAGELIGQCLRAVEVDAPAAAAPEEEFYEALEGGEVAGAGGVVGGENFGGVVGDGAVGLFEGEEDGDGAAGGVGGGAEGVVGEDGGAELRVERGGDARGGEVRCAHDLKSRSGN